MATAVILGDSIFSDADFYAAVVELTTFTTVDDYAVGGITIGEIKATYDAHGIDYDTVIVNGGTNNIRVANSDPNTVMRASMQSIIDDSITDGVELIVGNIPPFGGDTAWTSDRQIWLESYNTWLAAYCTTNSTQMVDSYTILKDPYTYEISAVYLGVDYVHPNALGSNAIASGIDFRANTTPEFTQGYRIRFGVAIDNYETLTLADPTYTQTGLELGTEYVAQVQSFYFEEESAWTDWVYVTTRDIDTLESLSILAESPVLGVPIIDIAIPEAVDLSPVSVITGNPVLGSPEFGQVHSLISVNIMTTSPLIGNPKINFVRSKRRPQILDLSIDDSGFFLFNNNYFII